MLRPFTSLRVTPTTSVLRRLGRLSRPLRRPVHANNRAVSASTPRSSTSWTSESRSLHLLPLIHGPRLRLLMLPSPGPPIAGSMSFVWTSRNELQHASVRQLQRHGLRELREPHRGNGDTETPASSSVKVSCGSSVLTQGQELLVTARVLQQQEGHDCHSLELFELALEAYRRNLGPDSKEVADILKDIARSHFRAGRFDRARERHEQALEIYRLRVGTDSNEVADTYFAIARTLLKEDRLDDALRPLNQAVAIYRRTKGRHCRQVADMLDSIAVIHLLQQRHEHALDFLNQAVEIRRRMAAPDSNTVLFKDLMNIGSIHLDFNRFDQALEAFRQSLQLSQQAFGTESSEVARVYLSIAMVHVSEGRLDQTRQCCDRALAIYQQRFGTHSKEVGGVLSLMADLHALQAGKL